MQIQNVKLWLFECNLSFVLLNVFHTKCSKTMTIYSQTHTNLYMEELEIKKTEGVKKIIYNSHAIQK